jgi:hypothetical protein
MSGCTVKHIECPIPDEEWRCPKCGDEDFCIDQSASEDVDCELFHAGDQCICNHCGGGWSLATVIKKWAAKKNMIQCPHCKGTGVIPKG